MGRAPCCDKASVKRGPWSPDEDEKLKQYIHSHGTGGNWIALPHKAGLNRCGKSCRLRWLNYLRPNIKHGDFTDDEDRIIYSLFTTIGSRWSIIAAQLPGRTDNDIKNYWNTKLKKKLSMGLILSSSDPPPPPPPPNVWSFAGSAANDDPSPSCRYINPLLRQQPYYYSYDHLLENSIGPDQASCSSSDGGSGGTQLGYGGGEMELDYGGYTQQRVMVSESCGVVRKEKVESGVWKEEIPLECSLEEISKLMISSSSNNNNNNNFSFENYKSTGETFMYYY